MSNRLFPYVIDLLITVQLSAPSCMLCQFDHCITTSEIPGVGFECICVLWVRVCACVCIGFCIGVPNIKYDGEKWVMIENLAYP